MDYLACLKGYHDLAGLSGGYAMADPSGDDYLLFLPTELGEKCESVSFRSAAMVSC